jgi:hypothetical protein
MGRRGSISFVIEVKRSRRRLPLALGTTDDPNGKGEARFDAIRPGGFAATPFSEGPRGYDPTVEAAKVAADKLFNRIRGSESAPVPAWNDRGARHADAPPPTQAASTPVPVAAREASTPQPPATNQVTQPRTGRVLESLTSVNPLEALFRQMAEEHAARPRRPRTPRSATAGETQPAARPDGKQGSTSKSATDPKGLLETTVGTTDPKEPRRSQNKSRRKTAERRLTRELGRKARRKRKTAVKNRRQAARPTRSAKPLATPKRSGPNRRKASVGKKRSATKTTQRKVLARKPAAHERATTKSATRKAAKASKPRKTPTKRMTSRRRSSPRARHRR